MAETSSNVLSFIQIFFIMGQRKKIASSFDVYFIKKYPDGSMHISKAKSFSDPQKCHGVHGDVKELRKHWDTEENIPVKSGKSICFQQKFENGGLRSLIWQG
jgi:hypothetical protein